MMRFLDSDTFMRKGLSWVLLVVIAFSAAYFGRHPSPLVLVALAAVIGIEILLRRPVLGLFGLIVAALLIPIEIGTGSDVKINPATILSVGLAGLWLLDIWRGRQPGLPVSGTTRPLIAFLLAGLVSLAIGQATWDPAVPKSSRFVIVQLAQWAIFFLSVVLFWFSVRYLRDEAQLRRLTFFYLLVAGIIAVAESFFGNTVLGQLTTFAVHRASFWVLLAAVTGGQLFFNEKLTNSWRIFLFGILGAVFLYAFGLQRDRLSNMAGIAVVFGVLVWLRWPRWRFAYVIALAAALILLYPKIYEFAGGDAKWDESGASRLVLISRVVSVTSRNPITGLGPAAYRFYAMMEPLAYQGAYWLVPLVNSHNNFVDLYSQLGLVGLGIFLWFAVALSRLGYRLHSRFTTGFLGGYVNGMIACWAGALAIMLLADWVLPFVYNIGFPGFQASILIWLFLGGLLLIDRLASTPAPTAEG